MTTRIGRETRERILHFFRTYTLTHDRPPTIREIRDAVGLSSINTVYCNLEVLVGEGRLIHLGKGSSRSFALPRVPPEEQARILFCLLEEGRWDAQTAERQAQYCKAAELIGGTR